MNKRIAAVILALLMPLACAKKEAAKDLPAEQVDIESKEGILAKRRQQFVQAARERIAAVEKKMDALQDTPEVQDGRAALRAKIKVLGRSLEDAKNQVVETWDKYERDVVELLESLEQEHDKVLK